MQTLDVAIGTYRINVINRIERDDVAGACDMLLNMNALLNKYKRLDMQAPKLPIKCPSTIFQRMQKQWLRDNLVTFEEHYTELLRNKGIIPAIDAIIEFYRKAIIARRDHQELLDACYLQWAQVNMLPEKLRVQFKPIPAKGTMLSQIYNRLLERWLSESSQLFERVYQGWKETLRNQFMH
jgi:hypothetical protein